jgi:hypothetical protein
MRELHRLRKAHPQERLPEENGGVTEWLGPGLQNQRYAGPNPAAAS